MRFLNKWKFQPCWRTWKRWFAKRNTVPCLISGGWLLVSNVVIDGSSPFQLSLETSYRGIGGYGNNKTFLTDSAMLELRTHLSFTQLRFYCSKQQGRTFHVTTITNASGEAVVQYFSGQTDVQPDACGSFAKMDDDDSLMAGLCNDWGVNGWPSQSHNSVYKIGKWGPPYKSQGRLSDHSAFVIHSCHWILYDNISRFDCDDHNDKVSPGDFWKVFVR